MDDFDNGGAGLPDEMTTELPDLEVVEAEVEIDLEGAAMAPAGRKSGAAGALRFKFWSDSTSRFMQMRDRG